MSQRRGKRKVNSDSVQGEGSWVEIDALTVKEVKEMRKQAANDDYDNFDAGIDLVKTHVLAWNWVDYDGEPMPAPKTYPAIVDTLTVDEINFLAESLMGEDKESKNSPVS